MNQRRCPLVGRGRTNSQRHPTSVFGFPSSFTPLTENTRLPQGPLQPLQILLSRNRHSAQPRSDRGKHLNIEQSETTSAQVFDQVVERPLGGIRNQVEH